MENICRKKKQKKEGEKRMKNKSKKNFNSTKIFDNGKKPCKKWRVGIIDDKVEKYFFLQKKQKISTFYQFMNSKFIFPKKFKKRSNDTLRRKKKPKLFAGKLLSYFSFCFC